MPHPATGLGKFLPPPPHLKCTSSLGRDQSHFQQPRESNLQSTSIKLSKNSQVTPSPVGTQQQEKEVGHLLCAGPSSVRGPMPATCQAQAPHPTLPNPKGLARGEGFGPSTGLYSASLRPIEEAAYLPYPPRTSVPQPGQD